MRDMVLLDSEIEQRQKHKKTTHFFTGFNFLKEHRGWRPGMLHTLMGTTGCGKSSLVRSVMLDFLSNEDRRIGLYLTEDSEDNVIDEFYSIPNPKKELFSRTVIFSEQTDLDFDYPLETTIADMVFDCSVDMVVIDNLTTSKYYRSSSIKDQETMVTRIKNTAQKLNIPILIVVHTGGNLFKNRLYEENDIRGCKALTLVSEFYYIMQDIKVGERRTMTLRVTKHRTQNQVEHTLFRMIWNKQVAMYLSDEKMSFEEMKEEWDQRNKLN